MQKYNDSLAIIFCVLLVLFPIVLLIIWAVDRAESQEK
jgi:hypothetical protein